MHFERSAGILLHPTSLPGKYGIGDLGPEAVKFVDFLSAAGQKLWQVFPLGPTGYGDSPYQCFSAFAGNPLLISPDKLIDEGLLDEQDVSDIPQYNPVEVDFGSVIDSKYLLLKKAFTNFSNLSSSSHSAWKKFCHEHTDWLDDYAFFMAAKEYHGGELWTKWEKPLVLKDSKSVSEWTEKLNDQINFQKFIQFKFYEQWKEIKSYANDKGISIIGDMPIFIAYDSADLWANRELFTVDDEGKLLTVAGVPPDYFSATGQLWGNPLYRWNKMEEDDFLWWRKRISNLLHSVDIIRIDHFRGFEAYWEIPGEALTAEKGKWVKAPGENLFSSLKNHLGELPILAEDLGVITKEVEHLRDKFEFPGMKILQFAFGTGMERKFLPHNILKNCVVYTGSHDNDTTRAYFEKEKHADNDIYSHAQKYLDYTGEDIVQKLIKTAYASAADIVIIPMQDVLNLGAEARMNFPGKLGGNWSWRFQWEQIPNFLADGYKELTKLYERPPILKQESHELN